MTDLPSRELRNNVSEVLRRVEAGERLRVTVSGRPVAQLVPLTKKPTTMGWVELQRGLEGARADPGLAAELSELVPDTTDDVSLP
ncbi:MAG: type II toxin-antitoxin system Phd/YefM family antitoxin [Acidimicrobiales bacterium]